MDKDKAIRNLEVILEKIHSDTDMSQLNEYHKLYKKEISLFKRSAAAAWLFMYYDKRETPSPRPAIISKSPVKPPVKSQVKPSEKSRNIKNDKTKSASDKPAVEINLSEEESKRLFISIGKNRRLFPREVITLIMSKTSTPREDIGIIRILDNYSFVQVRDAKADEIITALTGLRFRGRTLTVNFAKPKSPEADTDNN
ncbi:MAG: DbpA RNA binding domain-containing protein [Treponema sp.]|nr:DbpA RNA binding domain-containing protein [Treponema sp.]